MQGILPKLTIIDNIFEGTVMVKYFEVQALKLALIYSRIL